MAETVYRYLITDTLYDTVAVGKLAADVTDHPWITGTLLSVIVNGQNIDIKFAAALTTIEERRVWGMVCGHDGVAVKMIMSRPVVGLEVALSVGWADLDGFAFDPASVAAKVTRLVARLSGEWKTGNLGAELQIAESTDAGTEDKFSAPIAIPDTGGAWRTFVVDSNVALRDGVPPNIYRLLGRRAGAGATGLRYCELALIWV